MIKVLSDEAMAKTLHNVPGTKLKFESKLTDQDILAFKDELKIQLRAIAQEQLRDALRQVVGDLNALIKEVTLKAGNKAGALFAAQTRNYRQELKKQAEEK